MDENSKEKENESEALMARIQQLEHGTMDFTFINKSNVIFFMCIYN